MLAHDLIKFVFLAGFSCLFASMGWANSAPTDINASNLTIAENSAIGTVIGEFNATDPDGDAITYSLVPRLPTDLNLSLWLDASDFSTITETKGSVSQWADKSGNGNHAVQATLAKMPSYLVSSHTISFDGNDDFLETSGFNPSGPMTIYGVFANTREVLPSTGNYVDVVATISRAWARNLAGYGIGPVKKISIPEAPQLWWGTVGEIAGELQTSDWFGTFKYYEKGWLYHARLG